MKWHERIWPLIAGLFTVLNVGGVGYAIALREPSHAATHAAAVLFGGIVWWFVSRTPRAALSEASTTTQRLELLQQSVDAIALEVERISEAQRFSVRLQTERAERSALREESS
jgi:hypothetical protein